MNCIRHTFWYGIFTLWNNYKTVSPVSVLFSLFTFHSFLRSLPLFCSIWRGIWITKLCRGIKKNRNTKDTWHQTESDWSTWFFSCIRSFNNSKSRLCVNKRCNHFKMHVNVGIFAQKKHERYERLYLFICTSINIIFFSGSDNFSYLNINNTLTF